MTTGALQCGGERAGSLEKVVSASLRCGVGQSDPYLENESVRLDIPRRGYVLSTTVELYGQPLREAVAVLESSLARKPACADIYESHFGGPRWQPSPDMARPVANIAAWTIVSMWVTAIACRELSTSDSLATAEHWFFGCAGRTRLTDLPSERASRKAEALLSSKATPDAYYDLLPYILDPHGPGSRLSVRRNPETRVARERKRAKGVFYTPADIAEYMSAACLDTIEADQNALVYDPACGTGVFLRAALKELRNRNLDRDEFEIASTCLFGTDIDPWPLDAAAFVLLADIWANCLEKKLSPAEMWQRLRCNFACVDALRIDPALDDAEPEQCKDQKSRIPIDAIFPGLKYGPRVIIGNPPYANLGDRTDLSELGRTFKTLGVKPQANAEICLSFIEQMARLSDARHSAGALVLPLSIACNVSPQFFAARSFITETPGHWRFAFFDREPHALFGEDVKTRNAIVLLSRTPSDRRAVIGTGPLRKWRGDSRSAMFNSLQFTTIGHDIRAGIPKVDGKRQATALEVLDSRWTSLEQAVRGISRKVLAQAPHANNRTVFVGPTAYNFLNVFLKPPHRLLDKQKALSEHPLFAIECASREDALAVFAILTSHLTYWWWHTHGDGFHVSKRFIASIPFGIESLTGETGGALLKCGAGLWEKINATPIVSVNRGRTSFAYTPNGYDEVRRKSDEALASLAGLENAFVDELQQFTARTVAATLRVGD